MNHAIALDAPSDRLEQAGLFALFGVAGAVLFSIAIAQTATDATKSPTMTSLTTKSACWNKSQIEIGAPDGMASPCGCLFRLSRQRCPN